MQEASSVTEATRLAQIFREARSAANRRDVVGDRRVKAMVMMAAIRMAVPVASSQLKV